MPTPQNKQQIKNKVLRPQTRLLMFFFINLFLYKLQVWRRPRLYKLAEQKARVRGGNASDNWLLDHSGYRRLSVMSELEQGTIITIKWLEN